MYNYNGMIILWCILVGRRRRCQTCEGCRKTVDCGVCRFCRDKPKFGGRGTLKQACITKRCIRLVNPTEQSKSKLCNMKYSY